NAAPACAAARAPRSIANHTTAAPATTYAAPMSRTKCGLNGPLCGTPGTAAYQSAGNASMAKPLVAKAMPMTQAAMTRMPLACQPSKHRPFLIANRLHAVERQPPSPDIGLVGGWIAGISRG